MPHIWYSAEISMFQYMDNFCIIICSTCAWVLYHSFFSTSEINWQPPILFLLQNQLVHRWMCKLPHWLLSISLSRTAPQLLISRMVSSYHIQWSLGITWWLQLTSRCPQALDCFIVSLRLLHTLTTMLVLQPQPPWGGGPSVIGWLLQHWWQVSPHLC